MASVLNDTMATAKTLFGSAKDGAEHAASTAKGAVASAREGTGHAVSSARSTLLESIHAVTGIATALRSFDPGSALGLVGLQRRRGPFLSAAVFSAGFVAGAGAGVLFAPMAGADLRRTLLKSWRGFEVELKEVLGRAAAEVEQVEEKAEELVGKAKEAAKKVEGKVEGGAEALKSGAKTKAEAVASAVKEGMHDAKSMVSAATDPAHDSDGGKPARGAAAGHRAS